MNRTVRLADSHLLVDDVPTILLCASLFPFRIPLEQWAQRLRAVHDLGYHAIDVYIPWNFHEVEPGKFQFDADRDVDRFLRMAADDGLLVLARPGPYICSEFDGGGLPAWLGTVPGLRLRQNEKRYLTHVRQWYDRILPILARHQVQNGGAVALLQIENELDFFDCDDPIGYLEALRGMVDDHGISVPVISCAGQGDVLRAGGTVDGVAPAVNLYPDDRGLDIESRTQYYADRVNERGFPLLVTETNRLHRTVKRELAAGAVLLGPYLQASGWNYDYASSVGNWGNPLGLMASDYDFGGSIAPDGSERPDAAQGRILAQIISALGPALGAATAAPPPAVVLGLPGFDRFVATSARLLAGGGYLLGITNLSDCELVATIPLDDGELPVTIVADECRLVITGLPLHTVGVDGTLIGSDSELIELSGDGSTAHLTVHTASRACIILDLQDGWRADDTTGDAIVSANSPARFQITASIGTVTFVGPGRNVVVAVVHTTTASRRKYDPGLTGGESSWSASVSTVRLSPNPVDFAKMATPSVLLGEHPRPMEECGIYRGGAVYVADMPQTKVRGVLLGSAADIITVTIGDSFASTCVNGGTDLFIELDEETLASDQNVTVRTEIWGHSNFHDERLPSLRLGSLRGISSGSAITDVIELGSGWQVSSPLTQNTVGTQPVPLTGWGGWSSTRRPETLIYERNLTIPDDRDTVALRIRGAQVPLAVAIDGTAVGQITPLDPILDITDNVASGQATIIGISATRAFSEDLGSIDLLVGRSLSGWRLGAFAVPELFEDSRRADASSTLVQLPLTVRPGEARWLTIDARDHQTAETERDMVIRTLGQRIRLTLLHHDHIIGRVWSDPPANAPMTGGRGDIALAPAPWLLDDPIIRVLLEAATAQPGELNRFELSHQLDTRTPHRET